jgi:hypothetical protein
LIELLNFSPIYLASQIHNVQLVKESISFDFGYKRKQKKGQNCRQGQCIINTGHRLCHFANEIVAVRHPLQGTSLGVMVDFSNPASVYDNVRQVSHQSEFLSFQELRLAGKNSCSISKRSSDREKN